MMFISDEQCGLWSQKVYKTCILQGSVDTNFKIGAPHEILTYCLANGKESQSLRKNGYRQKCLDEALYIYCIYNIYTPYSILQALLI